MAKKYVWLKLQKDFFQQKEMKKLRRIAGGGVYTLIYLKMQLLSLENEGKLYFEGVEDDFCKEVALEIDEKEEDVQMTVMFLQKHALIEYGTVQDEYVLPAVQASIGTESAAASRMRKMREKKRSKQLEYVTESNKSVTACNNVTPMLQDSYNELQENVTSKNQVISSVFEQERNNVTPVLHEVTKRYTEREKEREKEKDIEREKSGSEAELRTQLSEMEFVDKIKLLKKAIVVATGKDPHQVDLVFRIPNYKENIDDVICSIKKSKYLQGKLDRRPSLNTFTVQTQINRIVAGAFEDFANEKQARATIDELDHKQQSADDLLASLGIEMEG